MSERLFLQPPEIVELDPAVPLIFLGGPIQGAPKWHYDAAGIIHDTNPDIVVASPRKEYAEGTFKYYPQVHWEHHYLGRGGYGVGTNLFYLPKQVEATPGRAYGQTSRVELGMWIMRCAVDPSINLVVGMPGEFGNERYLKEMIRLEAPTVSVIEAGKHTLEQTCMVAIERALAKAEQINTAG